MLQGYTSLDVFRLAEDFFVSMNMSAMPLEFWQTSVLEEPVDRVVLCQPSAWDFCNRRDFRYYHKPLHCDTKPIKPISGSKCAPTST